MFNHSRGEWTSTGKSEHFDNVLLLTRLIYYYVKASLKNILQLCTYIDFLLFKDNYVDKGQNKFSYIHK